MTNYGTVTLSTHKTTYIHRSRRCCRCRLFAGKHRTFLSHFKLPLKLDLRWKIYDRIPVIFLLSNCILLHWYWMPQENVAIKQKHKWNNNRERESSNRRHCHQCHTYHSITNFIVYWIECIEKLDLKQTFTYGHTCTRIYSIVSIIIFMNIVRKLNKIDLMLGWFTCVNLKENWL